LIFVRHVEGVLIAEGVGKWVFSVMSGLKRDEVTWEWRKLCNEELCDLYSYPNVTRVIKSSVMGCTRQVARMGNGRGACRVLVGKPEGKSPLGRARRRWKDNIKVYVKEIGWTGGPGIYLTR